MKSVRIFALLFTVAIIFSSCRDQDPPEITLNGDATVYITLGGSYIEQGATAIDDKDGELTSSIITDNSSVNTAVAGTYTVSYTVADKKGNEASRTRTVIVQIGQSNYSGAWSETDDCATWVAVSSSTNIAPGSGDTQIVFSPFSDLGGTLTADIAGQNITVSSQSVNLVTVSGTGSISDNAKTIILNLDFDSGIATESCTLTYTK